MKTSSPQVQVLGQPAFFLLLSFFSVVQQRGPLQINKSLIFDGPTHNRGMMADAYPAAGNKKPFLFFVIGFTVASFILISTFRGGSTSHGSVASVSAYSEEILHEVNRLAIEKVKGLQTTGKFDKRFFMRV